MARQVVDIFLDKDGKVVSDPRYAAELRRTIIENGRVVERSVAYRKNEEPSKTAV